VRVLAIDQGTSATKAVVFGSNGEILSCVEAAVTPQAVPGGGVEQDPEQLWESICAAGSEEASRPSVSQIRVRRCWPGTAVRAGP